MTIRVFPLICLASLLALSTGVARAEVPGLIYYGQFPTKGGLGVAVDQSTGDVFTAGFLELENGTVHGLGHSQKFEFDALGEVESSSSFGEEALYAAAAVNPTDGDVYFLNAGSAEIQTYDPNTGLPVSSFPVPPSDNNSNFGGVTVVQIAADSEGDVYVPVVPENKVLEYGETKPGEWNVKHEFTGGSGAGALKGPTGVAVDSAGDLWVAGDGWIEELSPSDTPMTKIRSVGVTGVALDSHGDVLATVDNAADFCGEFVPPCDHLLEYNPAGTQIADLGAGDFGASPEAELGELPSMLAVNEKSGRVYVTDMGKNLVWVFGPPTVPAISGELAAEVGTSEAKLGALVNPGGIGTRYRFEYGRTAEYGQSVPFPEGSVGEELSSRTVWAAAKGLAPGTTYHYRVVASNALGTVYGRDQTFTTETAAETSCPNEQVRGGFSASLSDCRAYELVTPSNDASAQPDTEHPPIGAYPAGGGLQGNRAARDGDRMAFVSSEVLPGSRSGGLQYVSTRGASGWSTEDVIPLESYTADRCTGLELPVMAYSADLSRAVLRHPFGGGGAAVDGGGGSCDVEPVEVVKGEPLGLANLLLRDNTAGSYQLVDVTPPGIKPVQPTFLSASADLEHVIFSENAQLTSDAPAGAEDVYEWSGGAVRLVTVLPDGAPVAGSFVGISPDGSDVFFSAGGDLYVRLNGERTVQVDEARGGSGPGGGGSFRAVTADGSQVFFTDEASAGLTSDTHSGSGENLYSYDVDTGQLSDLTPLSDAKAALAGISEDASYVYYYAETALTGSQSNQLGETAQDGKPNLYLEHEGAIAFIAHEGVGVGQLSPNGAFFAFNSASSLTGYDNAGEGEIYLYSAASNRFVCASCNPSGEAPTAGGVGISGAPHSVSNNGQVFFQTGEALLPADTNGKEDVYEYEAGQLRLISTGTGAGNSILLDTSEDGRDVFFLTRQKLLPQDTDEEALSIYDARVDGGFPEPVSPPACTTPEGCRGAPAPQPAIFGAPASQTFSGVGDLTPAMAAKPQAKPKPKPTKCKKGDVKNKRGKCIKKKRKIAKQAKRASRDSRSKS